MQRRTALKRIATAGAVVTAASGVAAAVDDQGCEPAYSDHCTLPMRYCEPEYCPPDCCTCACEDDGGDPA